MFKRTLGTVRFRCRLRTTILSGAILLGAAPALADIELRFDEGAPKDRFTLRNAGDCAIENAEVTIDLSGSAGRLVFDVTGGGAGVEVFQPFEVVEGEGALGALPEIGDGDDAVTLAVTSLAPGAAIAFTIDVDDTLKVREITVTDSEIAGGTVRVSLPGTTVSGTFSGSNVVRVALRDCSG